MDCETETGFGNKPGALNGTLESTFYALYILDGFNRLGNIDSEAMIEYVNKCRNTDHGYGNTFSAASDLYSTYYALWICAKFDVNLDNDTDEWVAGLYNATEGFTGSSNETGSLGATYYGLESLYLNDTNLEKYNLSSWLLGRQNDDIASDGYGGFATDGNKSNLWATWTALASINRLNITGGFLISPLVLWINSSQDLNIYEESYGAFSSKPSATDYSLLNSFAAIYSLKALGSAYLSSINLEQALNWILDLQNDDGGFRISTSEGDSILSASYYAFYTLKLSGELNKLNEDVPWEYGFELPLWAWILIGIAVTIAAILIIRKYYSY